MVVKEGRRSRKYIESGTERTGIVGEYNGSTAEGEDGYL